MYYGDIIGVVAPLAVTLGLAQWITRFILSAILGDYRGTMN